MPNKIYGTTGFLDSDPTAAAPTPGTTVNCIWLNYTLANSQVPPLNGLRTYKIRRQPVPGSDQPLQFPRGIGIDLQASGALGPGNTPDLFDFITGGADVVNIMFAPNGQLQDFYFNGVKIQSASQIFMNIGRYENGNGKFRPEDYDFITNSAVDQDLIRQRMARINWLNTDSMWVTINRAGRIVTSESKTVDPLLIAQAVQGDSNITDKTAGQFIAQRAAARAYAEQMSSMGGRGR
jgi:hypothetical protein